MNDLSHSQLVLAVTLLGGELCPSANLVPGSIIANENGCWAEFDRPLRSAPAIIEMKNNVYHVLGNQVSIRPIAHVYEGEREPEPHWTSDPWNNNAPRLAPFDETKVDGYIANPGFVVKSLSQLADLFESCTGMCTPSRASLMTGPIDGGGDTSSSGLWASDMAPFTARDCPVYDVPPSLDWGQPEPGETMSYGSD